jgi:CBS domain containing-hemolysin-like protein
MPIAQLMELTSLILLGLASAFFSSAETIFFSLNPMQVRRLSQVRPVAGALVHQILATPTRLLSTILIGNTIVNVAIAAVGFALAEHYVPAHGEVVAIPIITLLLIIFGEAGPKRLGLRHATNLAPIYAPILRFLILIATPLRFFLERLTRTLEPLLRPHGRTLSEEEFQTVLEISGEEGILNADELAMIKSIIQLEDMKASDVMTPRVDLIGLDLDEVSADVAARAQASRRNFLLLYRGQMDNVEGFLDVRKFLLDPDHRLEAARLPGYFIPESTSLSRLITQFQSEQRRIAVVVDEYGGVAGVVTRGDILEEITGEIYQELNKPRPLFQPAGPQRWLMDANFSLEELNRKLGLNLEAAGVDRLAGWIAHQKGHVPEKDDVVTAQGVRVTVLQTLRLRVTLAQLEKLPEDAA